MNNNSVINVSNTVDTSETGLAINKICYNIANLFRELREDKMSGRDAEEYIAKMYSKFQMVITRSTELGERLEINFELPCGLKEERDILDEMLAISTKKRK